jgi:polar amino acid transport system substrate-binding protein
MLSLYSDRLPGSRVLLGRYTVIQHAGATPKGRPAGAEFVKAFVEGAKRDGTVSSAITEAGWRRTEVPPAAAAK